MDFKAHFLTAWNLIIGNIVSLVLLTLVMVAVSFISLGILGPVTMAGYMHAILLLKREGREPRIQDLFSQFHLFLPLFLLGLVVVVLIMIGFTLLILPGILLSLAAGFCLLYVLPLMTDKGMGLVDALKESFRMSVENIVDQVVIVIIYMGLAALGGSLFIAWLFTQPLATAFLMSVYEEKTGRAT